MEGLYTHIAQHGWTKDGSAMEPAMAMGKAVWDRESEGREFYSDYRTFENCTKMFFEYLNYYSGDHQFLEVIAPEEVFNVVIPMSPIDKKHYPNIADQEVHFTGKIDLKIRLSGLRWMLEFKTTGQELSVQAARLQRSPQILGYTYAHRIMHEEPVEGMLVSLCHASSRKSRTTGDYGQLKTDFQRPPQIFSSNDLEAWHQEFLDVADRIAICEARQHYPKCHDSCYQFGQCSYTAICQQNRELSNSHLDGYIIKFWDVEAEE
jgi:hypothetical protein